jgi:hypothetical protein
MHGTQIWAWRKACFSRLTASEIRFLRSTEDKSGDNEMKN